jgi:hypothetical protein
MVQYQLAFQVREDALGQVVYVRRARIRGIAAVASMRRWRCISI